MFPDPIFWHIHWYGVWVAIGVLVAFVIIEQYGKKAGVPEKTVDFVYYAILASIVVGFGSAALFQAVYDFIQNPAAGFHISGSITFLGGLIGGALCFFLASFFYRKKLTGGYSTMLTVIPCAITAAHGFGRIGCFFAGCCYGKPTDSWLGVQFPDLPGPVHPTQLYESAFLFLLFAVLTVLFFRKKGKYNFPIYLSAYGIFRFLNEFLRGDHRGSFVGNVSPSQFWSLVMIAIGLLTAILICKKKADPKPEEKTECESDAEAFEITEVSEEAPLEGEKQ